MRERLRRLRLWFRERARRVRVLHRVLKTEAGVYSLQNALVGCDDCGVVVMRKPEFVTQFGAKTFCRFCAQKLKARGVLAARKRA